MAKKFEDLRKGMSAERQREAKEKADAMMAKMPMYSMRDALRFTQQQLAEEMGVNQAAISKMERRPDLLVSTLRRFVEAMGGELELNAHFPNGSVSITDLGEPDEDERKQA